MTDHQVPPDPDELLALMQVSCEAFLRDRSADWDVIARQTMVQFGLTDLQTLLAAIHEAIWEAYPNIIRARHPRAAAKSIARRAAKRQAAELLPEAERACLKYTGRRHRV
ncbi:MAG: hypothetical protein WC145_05855 [Aliarcobacter sp.]